MDNSFAFADIDRLTEIVSCKLKNRDLISDHERIKLDPFYSLVCDQKQVFHCIITCTYSDTKFFLKVLKDTDAALHCNRFLKSFYRDSEEKLYPEIVVPSFTVCKVKYYITTFIEGQTLEAAANMLSPDAWESVACELQARIDELASIHSPWCSESGSFTYDDPASVFMKKRQRRLRHPLFLHYPQEMLEGASLNCQKIMASSSFSRPTLLHMDIKPANIIYNFRTGHVALIDFEFSRFGDADYGWTQVLLSGVNSFGADYSEKIVSKLQKGRLTLNDCLEIPKLQCYVFYQTACNLIYYNDRHIKCPDGMRLLFEEMLDRLYRER